jgi:hypothetical protein
VDVDNGAQHLAVRRAQVERLSEEVERLASLTDLQLDLPLAVEDLDHLGVTQVLAVVDEDRLVHLERAVPELATEQQIAHALECGQVRAVELERLLVEAERLLVLLELLRDKAELVGQPLQLARLCLLLLTQLDDQVEQRLSALPTTVGQVHIHERRRCGHVALVEVHGLLVVVNRCAAVIEPPLIDLPDLEEAGALLR